MCHFLAFSFVCFPLSIAFLYKIIQLNSSLQKYVCLCINIYKYIQICVCFLSWLLIKPIRDTLFLYFLCPCLLNFIVGCLILGNIFSQRLQVNPLCFLIRNQAAKSVAPRLNGADENSHRKPEMLKLTLRSQYETQIDSQYILILAFYVTLLVLLLLPLLCVASFLRHL